MAQLSKGGWRKPKRVANLKRKPMLTMISGLRRGLNEIRAKLKSISQEQLELDGEFIELSNAFSKTNDKNRLKK